MKWLLVLISLNLYNDGTADHFVFTNMMYDSLQSCLATAQFNMKTIEEVSIREFNGPAKVYCFREDKFKQYLQTQPKPEPKKLDI